MKIFKLRTSLLVLATNCHHPPVTLATAACYLWPATNYVVCIFIWYMVCTYICMFMWCVERDWSNVFLHYRTATGLHGRYASLYHRSSAKWKILYAHTHMCIYSHSQRIDSLYQGARIFQSRVRLSTKLVGNCWLVAVGDVRRYWWLHLIAL